MPDPVGVSVNRAFGMQNAQMMVWVGEWERVADA